jgi:hypothetical protein
MSQVVDTTGQEALFLDDTTLNVGIGTTTPASKLEIDAQDALRIVGFQPFLTLTDSENNLNAQARIQNASGDINFFTQASLAAGVPPMKIQNSSGDVAISGTLTVAVDILLTGADCAEHFDIGGAEQIEPGTVVVIDREGALRRSEEEYDKRVAGVVSGAGEYRAGIVLDKQQSQGNRAPVALVGKVYCKVDAQYSSIEVGDLLTPSPTPGHAMKAVDPLRAFGAVIGKALRPLQSGTGLIPVLVALQ